MAHITGLSACSVFSFSHHILALSLWGLFVLPLAVVLTQRCVVIGNTALPSSLPLLPSPCYAHSSFPSSSLWCPFCVENLYLLWECNLFLMDNMTLSGAGSWVS